VWLFLVLQFVSLSRQVFITNFGAEWNILGYASNVGSILVFITFLIAIRNVDRIGYFSGLPAWGRIWWWLTALLVLFGVLLGTVTHHYIFKFVALDSVPYFVIFGMVLVGSKPTAFHYFVKSLLMLLYAAIPLNLYALTDIGELAAQSGEGDRFGVTSLGYETQATLATWPLLLLLSNGLKRGQAILVFVGVLIYAGMMIIFQKRLGTAMVLLVVTLYVHQSLHVSRYRIGRVVGAGRHYLRELSVIAFLALFVLLVGGRGLLAEQAAALFGRFSFGGQSGYSQGIFSLLTLENERIRIVYECFSGFGWYEWFIGRGMGGAFEWSSFNTNLLATDRSETLLSQYFLPDLGYFGRREFEIGIMMPMLKGGLLLTAALFSGVLNILFSPQKIRRDFYSSAAYYSVLYVSVFLLHGGGFILADSFTLIIWGISIGRCLYAVGPAAAEQSLHTPALSAGFRH